MKTELAQLPYQGHRSRQMADKSWQTIVDHPELLPEEVAAMVATSTTAGWLVIKPNQEVTIEDIPEADAPVEADMKTPSQRLRAVIWRLWETNGSKGEFDSYYRKAMESLITQLKQRLEA